MAAEAWPMALDLPAPGLPAIATARSRLDINNSTAASCPASRFGSVTVQAFEMNHFHPIVKRQKGLVQIGFPSHGGRFPDRGRNYDQIVASHRPDGFNLAISIGWGRLAFL